MQSTITGPVWRFVSDKADKIISLVFFPPNTRVAQIIRFDSVIAIQYDGNKHFARFFETEQLRTPLKGHIFAHFDADEFQNAEWAGKVISPTAKVVLFYTDGAEQELVRCSKNEFEQIPEQIRLTRDEQKTISFLRNFSKPKEQKR